jgi:putative SOS response-associated peptidase YedK
MCGRFAGFQDVDRLKAVFPIDRVSCEVKANYNVAPTQEVLAIVRESGENRLDRFHWGLVPFWAKDISMGARMINARAETVASKPSFRNAFKKRRCLIPADGFYEWQRLKGKKQPMFISPFDGKPFAFAGLWERWNEKGKRKEDYRSCTIITTAASDELQKVHHRMPVILHPDQYAFWLDPENQDQGELEAVIREHIVTAFKIHPVSTRVNAVRHNDPSNIKPLSQMEIDFDQQGTA